MPISYVIDEQQNVIYETWTGDIYALDLENYWTTYLKDPRVTTIRRTLVDLRESVIHITGDEISRLVQHVVLPVLRDKDWKTAIVVDKPIQFGISRQYQVFAELYSCDSIFFERDKALCWLLEEQ